MTPKLFTIAPHAPFLETLANRVLDGTLTSGWPREGLFWLSDITIILPTRRAAEKLALIFSEKLGGAALLPDIRTFGGEAEDEEPFLPPHEAEPLPPAVAPVTRRLLLAELVSSWLQNNPQSPLAVDQGPNPVQILSLSDSLATLIDDFITEGTDPHNLENRIERDLSDYWRESLKFLDIALTAWPDMLAELGRMDAAQVRNERLLRQAATVAELYDDRPVIAAGSTGSIPATAALMRQIARLPRGALVLPGLDTGLSEQSLSQLRAPGEDPHGHAQYHLVHLLDQVGAQPSQVEELADLPAPRTTLVRHALGLAEQTAHWHAARADFSPDILNAALSPVAIAAAHGEQEQAAAVALAGLEALRQNRQVGIIAPDRNLARRIVSELQRFGIDVDDSAGTPLHQSRAGRLVRQLLAAANSGFAAIDLMALLRNRYVTLGRSRTDMAALAAKLEFGLLRGQRPMPGLEGLKHLMQANLDRDPSYRFALNLNNQDAAELEALLADLDEALAPVIGLMEKQFRAAELAEALCWSLEHLRAPVAGEAKPELPGQAELTRWATALTDSAYPGPVLDRESADPALPQLMAGFAVRPRGEADPRIAIWGRLEARLQPADLLILTALNEGTWPEVADPGPWLSRQMRLDAGLEPPERQHGLAAHDFEMALGAPEVLMTYAERSGGSPAVPSRLLQRLTAFAGADATAGMLERGRRWVEAARQIDLAPLPAIPATRPEPAPPASKRPRRISVTQVEKLFRSPYELYAEGTLDLSPLEALGAEPGARERGNFIHEVFARFVSEDGDPFAADAHDRLMQMAVEVFSRLEAIPERRDIWLNRFARSADRFLAFERDRAPQVSRRFAEQRLGWTMKVAGEEIRLYGFADRVDLLNDGRVEIIDFKSGSIPTKSEMQNFLAPQLLLEALIVREAGFTTETGENIAPLKTGALTYIQLGASPRAFEVSPYILPSGTGMEAALDMIHRLLTGHIQTFLLSDSQPMMAGLMPRPNQRFAGDYDHLSRQKEWTSAGGEEGE